MLHMMMQQKHPTTVAMVIITTVYRDFFLRHSLRLFGSKAGLAEYFGGHGMLEELLQMSTQLISTLLENLLKMFIRTITIK